MNVQIIMKNSTEENSESQPITKPIEVSLRDSEIVICWEQEFEPKKSVF